MIDTALCTIVEGMDVRVEDLQTALDLLLRRRLDLGKPRLVGRKSLELHCEGRNICVRLTAKTMAGLHFEADAWMVLPQAADYPLLRIGLEWESIPVSDGSAVYCGRPRLRLLAEGDVGDDGDFVLARQASDGLVPLPMPGDHLDSCAATAAWAREVEFQLDKADRLLAALLARLQRTGAPPLSWMWLLQPILSNLSLARGLPADTAPEELIGRCRRWLVAMTELPARATLLSDNQIAELVMQLPIAAENEEPAAFHELCEFVTTRLSESVAVLGKLLNAVGSGLNRLPDLLYHSGKLYRRRAPVQFRSESIIGPSAVRHFAGAPNSGLSNLAILWETSEAMLLGDVRFVPQAPRRATISREEVFLGNLDPGVDFHWLPDVSTDSARLESPSNLRLLDVAAYEPVISTQVN